MTQARRWMAEDFGGPEVLNEVLVDLPEPGTGDVTVEIRACANRRSGPFRAAARPRILELAAQGKLTVPIGQTFPLSEAPAAVQALRARHPYGKLALVADGFRAA